MKSVSFLDKLIHDVSGLTGEERLILAEAMFPHGEVSTDGSETNQAVIYTGLNDTGEVIGECLHPHQVMDEAYHMVCCDCNEELGR